MRPFNSADGWDEVLNKVRSLPVQWSLGMTGLLLESATHAVMLGVQAGPIRISIQKATKDKRLMPVGSWEQQEDGNWISKEWGTATKPEMVDQVEALCRSLLSV